MSRAIFGFIAALCMAASIAALLMALVFAVAAR